MQETAYQQWWDLHVRAARGEQLSPEERATYDTVRVELERDETLAPLESARQARRELRELETQRRDLEQRRQQLDAEIAAVESALGPQARELLGVEEQGMPHRKHEQVRARWGGRCGYCGVGEEEVGGELTVDHFVPLVAEGGDGDDNLIYACFRCNLFKGDFHPSPKDREKGRLLLHPSRDNVSEHVRLEEATGILEPRTETGRFHIALLRLNRPALVALRLRRHFYELLLERKELAEAENAELRAIIRSQEKYIARLKGLAQDR